MTWSARRLPIAAILASFLPPCSKGEQWLISAQHTEDDVDRYLATVEKFAQVIS